MSCRCLELSTIPTSVTPRIAMAISKAFCPDPAERAKVVRGEIIKILCHKHDIPEPVARRVVEEETRVRHPGFGIEEHVFEERRWLLMWRRDPPTFLCTACSPRAPS